MGNRADSRYYPTSKYEEYLDWLESGRPRTRISNPKLSKEDIFIRDVIELCRNLRGVVAWRHSRGFYSGDGNSHGVADIMGVKNGIPFAIEIKTHPREMQRASQKIFCKDFEAVGGVYVLVRKMEEVRKFLEDL